MPVYRTYLMLTKMISTKVKTEIPNISMVLEYLVAIS